jgi:hypothetical protein
MIRMISPSASVIGHLAKRCTSAALGYFQIVASGLSFPDCRFRIPASGSHFLIPIS